MYMCMYVFLSWFLAQTRSRIARILGYMCVHLGYSEIFNKIIWVISWVAFKILCELYKVYTEYSEVLPVCAFNLCDCVTLNQGNRS